MTVPIKRAGLGFLNLMINDAFNSSKIHTFFARNQRRKCFVVNERQA